MKKLCVSLIIILIAVFIAGLNFSVVKAESLNDEINSQLENIDFAELQDFFENLENIPDNFSFFDNVSDILSGTVKADYSNIFSYIFSTFFSDVYEFIPAILGIIAISLFTGVIEKIKSVYLSEGVSEIITFVSVLSVVLLFSTQILEIYNITKDVVLKITTFNEVISPILLTLMVASGGTVSASVYKPIVAVLSGSVINIINVVVLPLSGLVIIFSIISNFSVSVRLNKFIELFNSIIKWVLGITVTVFGIFLSVQGIVSSIHDGVSLRATKYAISNSVPIIGGFLRDGFDLVLCGSVLIKNALGISSVFILFFIIIAPILKIMVFSILLKLSAGIIDCFSNSKVANLCESIAKSLSHFTVCILMVGFMVFISILLMIFSANAIL